MSRSLFLLIYVVLICGYGATTRARAEGVTNSVANPLVEMRIAAEEQADVDPHGAAAYRPRGTDQPRVRLPSVSAAETAIKDAMREAVRGEVKRELSVGDSSSSTNAGRGNNNGNANSNEKNKADKADSANEDAPGKSARGAAMSAQEAKRNSDVKQREIKLHGGGQGNGKKP